MKGVLYFPLCFFIMRLTYRDAEVVKNAAVHKFIRVVVFVRREKFTRKSIVDVRDSPQVE